MVGRQQETQLCRVRGCEGEGVEREEVERGEEGGGEYRCRKD